MPRIPTVLVYAVRDDQVLLMQRHKEPNLGLWIAPGGKIELHESPHDAARREMQEETGLVVEDLVWRGFCTEVSPLPDWQWMLFIYVARTFHGTLRPDLREGELAWVEQDRYLRELPIPQADRIFAPRVLGEASGMFEAKFVYDADLKLVSWVAY
ncbi:MAG: 8-oxo-dGTP diphosphatase [Anaerolineae bacterium]|nr:8-oxo-dGTP diphosphatase [Anaerolineae bacterium]